MLPSRLRAQRTKRLGSALHSDSQRAPKSWCRFRRGDLAAHQIGFCLSPRWPNSPRAPFRTSDSLFLGYGRPARIWSEARKVNMIGIPIVPDEAQLGIKRQVLRAVAEV